MTQEKGSVGAFYNIYNGMHFFFKFRTLSSNDDQSNESEKYVKKILHALNQIRGLLALFFLKYLALRWRAIKIFRFFLIFCYFNFLAFMLSKTCVDNPCI